MNKLNKRELLISVLMTARKYDSYFKEALGSIIDQTHRPIEIILIVESELEVYEYALAEACRGKSGISYQISHSKIPSFCYCINRAIDISRGEFLARMDTDDISHPSRFEMQVNYLLENSECTILGTKAIPIDAESKRIGKESLPFYGSDSAIRAVLPYRNPIFHSSVMFRKSDFTKFGAYKYDYHAQDHEMWIRYSFFEEVQFFNLDMELYYYRRHEGQCTNLANASSGFIDVSAFMFKYFLKTGNVKFLFGMLVAHPYLRRVRSLTRGFR